MIRWIIPIMIFVFCLGAYIGMALACMCATAKDEDDICPVCKKKMLDDVKRMELT